jgi:hypothetical protein
MYHAQAKHEYELLEASIKQLRDTYSKLLSYFGEDDSLSSHDFFDTINKFVVEFSATRDSLEKARQAEAKKKREAEAKAQRQATLQAKVILCYIVQSVA